MKQQIILPLFLLFLTYLPVSAICVWTGAGDGMTFSDDANWSCGHMPGIMDEVVLGPGAVVTLDVSTMVKALELDGGTITGTEMLDVSDGILWKSGIIDVDMALVSGPLSMVTGGVKELSKMLILKMTTTGTWDDGMFLINSGGELIIEFMSSFGTTFNGAIDFSSFSPGKIINAGYFEKAAGGDTTFVNVFFENDASGTVAVAAGTMRLLKGVTDNVGTLHTDTTATLQIADSSMHDVGTIISGKGTFEFMDVGPHILTGSYTGSFSLVFNSDSVTVDGAFSTSGPVEILSGKIDGVGSVTVEKTGTWSGGVIDVPFVIEPAASWTLSESASKTLSSVLTQSGSTTWTGGDLAIQDGGSWSNAGSFTAGSTGDFTFTGTAGSFINTGNFIKTALGYLSVPVSFTNSGLIGGLDTFSFSGFFSHTGSLSPGLSPGILTVDGDFTNGALLAMEIEDGSGAGTGHDQLVVTGAVVLKDTLRLTETGTVPNGTYTILRCEGTSPCISGSFSVVDIPADYAISVLATEVTLTKSILPVELVAFQATPVDDHVELEWETATETNNAYFAVERSVDGKDFKVIDRVAGQGTSTLSHRYQVRDQPLSAGAILYYRLRQVDFDGKSSLSVVRAVRWRKDRRLAIHHFIRKDQYQLDVFIKGNDLTGGAVVSLVSLSGHLLARKRIVTGQSAVTFKTSIPLTDGIYIVNVLNRKDHSARKVFLAME